MRELVSIGIAPGLRHLAYAVLQFGDTGPVLLDSDVLKGGRPSRELTFVEIASKFRVHAMILEVVWERHTPAVVGIGPRAATDEPSAYADFARSAVRAISLACGVRAVQVGHDSFSELGRSLSVEVKRRVQGSPSQIRDRKVLLAIGAALCAGIDTQRPVSERVLD